MDRALASLAAALMTGLLLAACAMRTPVTFTVHSYVVAAPSEGDAAAGREAFIALRCHACHRVAEDPTLPSLEGALLGPVLHDLGKRSPAEVGWAIVTRGRLDPGSAYETEMAEAAAAMTERQLVDVIVYLRDPASATNARQR